MNIAEFTSVPNVFYAESTEGNSKAETSGEHRCRNRTTHHQGHRGGASKERGSEEGEKKEKRWGSCAGNSAYRIANPTAQY
jgi:hypothetical protein